MWRQKGVYLKKGTNKKPMYISISRIRKGSDCMK